MPGSHLTDRLYVRLGDRKYRVERPWGRMPDDGTLGSVSAVGVDSGDNVYAVVRRDAPADPEPRDSVVVFDADGTFLRSFGREWLADGHGIFVTADDTVLVCDRDAHQVCAFDPDGLLLFTLGERHEPMSPFNHPTDVAVAPSGDIYVSDGYAGTRIHRFSATGEAKGAWGGTGSGPGEFDNPHAVWVLDDGRVLVADRGNLRIQVFTADGDYITEWPDFDHPADIYVDRDGIVHVTDEAPRLSAVTTEGAWVGRARPTLNTPHTVYGDSRGNLYLSEVVPPRITRLTLES